MCSPTAEAVSTGSSQDARTRFVVGGMVLMFVMSWMMSLGRLFGTHFWDQKYNLEHVYGYNDDGNIAADPTFYNSTAISEIGRSYFSNRRYVFFLPHVCGAIFWWNLYFLQLIPQIRHRFKSFHRYLGRCLMVVALLQTSSGLGLACTTHSTIIKLVSFILAFAVFYCIYYAWRYAMHRDIPMHKYWVIRLVGYMQTIALQRFWLLVLIASHQLGYHCLYPSLDGASQEAANKVVLSMFDDSFVLSILTAILVTEWYLAGMMNMTKAPVTSEAYRKVGLATPIILDNDPNYLSPAETRPLL